MFQEFYQLGNPERERRNGLGLGLAIAQGLAETLDHALGLQSQVQRGSVFKLTLPVAQKSLPSELAAAVGEKALLTRNHANRLQGVLVIDDDPAVLAAMAQLLGYWGCVVDSATTVEQASSMAQQQCPALVIRDYRLRNNSTGA